MVLYDMIDEAAGMTYGPYIFEETTDVPESTTRVIVTRHVCDDILDDGSCGHLAPTIPGIY